MDSQPRPRKARTVLKRPFPTTASFVGARLVALPRSLLHQERLYHRGLVLEQTPMLGD
ncbi:hypothetical protein VDGL01_01921 [Verticillium dahliae]